MSTMIDKVSHRFAKLFLSFALATLGSCDRVGDCLDARGRWVEEIQQCECTYRERGNYSIHITDEELAACVKPRSLKSDLNLNKEE